MTKYPILPAREIIAALKRLGFVVAGQKGSHIKMCKYIGGHKIITIIPNHKTVMPGTLKGILELAEVELVEFTREL